MGSSLRRLAPIVILPYIVACAAEPPPATPVEIAAPAAPTPSAEAAAPLGPLDISLPADAAAVGALQVRRLGRLLDVAVLGLGGSQRAELERELGLGAGLTYAGWLERELGLDPNRQIDLSLGAVGGVRAAKERLLALIGKPASPELTAELRSVIGGAGAGLACRIVLPTRDAARTMGAVGKLLAKLGAKEDAPPPGVDRMYLGSDERGVAVTSAGAHVVVDVVVPAGAANVRRAVMALRARPPGGPHEAPLALGTHVARVRWQPRALATIGLVHGVSKVLAAVSGASVEPGQRDAIVAVGLGEAAVNDKLAGPAAAAPDWERVEVALEGRAGALAMTLRALPGAQNHLPAAGWAQVTEVRAPGTMVSLGISIPWVRSWSEWPSQVDSPEALQQATREAGWFGLPIALPQMIALGLWAGMSPLHRFPGLFEASERYFVTRARESEADVFAVLLMEGKLPADVACALARDAACAPHERLRPGATLDAHGLHARLVQVKGRWLVVASRDKTLVGKLKPELDPPAGPATMEVSGALLAEPLAPLPASLLAERYRGEVRLDGAEAVVELRPIPAVRVVLPPRRKQ